MARLKSNFIGLDTLADVVHKRNVLKKINGRMHVCEWPKTDKDRVLSLDEMCNREKFMFLKKHLKWHLMLSRIRY